MRQSKNNHTSMILSICIATYNRAQYIRETLGSILPQVPDCCEVVVCDNASTDQTSEILSDYERRFPCLRYFRHDTNLGLERNFDFAVTTARGDYCWLFTDDDLMKPTAIGTVLQTLRERPALVVVNVESYSTDASEATPRYIEIYKNHVYTPQEADQFFRDIMILVRYIGAFVIQRSVWLARDRERYLGSLFTHVGVVFQDLLPGNAVVVAEPLVRYRWGNVRSFSSNMFETFEIAWPSVVSSLHLSEETKRTTFPPEPWRSCEELLFERALGHYSLKVFNQHLRPRLGTRLQDTWKPVLIAIIPGTLLNFLYVSYYRVTRRRRVAKFPLDVTFRYLSESPYHYTRLKFWKTGHRKPVVLSNRSVSQ